ncbi:MAG: selenide, water dikinase SelD [Candidatus Acidiferrum sp.]
MSESVKLTAMVKAAGCAAKLSPGMLDSILRGLPRSTDPNVLVGFDTNDDAGVYQLDENLAIVQTVDFFTPIADDPFTFGQIAATNALSDIYAMGGRPVSALSLVGFPAKGEIKILEEIIRGGLDKMSEARCSVIGGHSIRNDDIIFGYAVTGVINPKEIWRNVGARTNDILLFTKSIGTGVLSTATKNDRIGKNALEAAILSMTTLNRAAADALHSLELQTGAQCVHAVTDVTGFSLLGHAREMALGDPEHGLPQVSFEVSCHSVPVLPGALEAVRDGMIPGGLNNNRSFIGDCVAFAENVPEENRALLFDPQTAGGLLVAIAPEFAGQAIELFHSRGIPAARIGRVLQKTSPLISVL